MSGRVRATVLTVFLDFACDPSNRHGDGCDRKICGQRRNKAAWVVVARWLRFPERAAIERAAACATAARQTEYDREELR
jgi:hypothetical protein